VERLKVGIPKERAEGEKRVSLTPDGVKLLTGRDFTVLVEKGAGLSAEYSDQAYEAAGAKCVGADELYQSAELVLKVMAPANGSDGELAKLRPGTATIGFLFPATNLDVVKRLAAGNISSFAIDLMPRITRAQSMDALSSMSTIAGYKGALLAASALPKFFPMLMTAAGTLSAARVLVIGAGVAGLQAIATCKRLGAIVEAFDVRPAVKEQVESLGARFVELQHVTEKTEDVSGYAKELSHDTHVKELELIASRLPKVDAVISTALIPGKRAPILITADMLSAMQPGSVIVDLAAPNGGNVEGTVPGQSVRIGGVTVFGPVDLLSQMAMDASRMYSKNMTEFVTYLAPEGTLKLDLQDEIVAGTLVTHEGKVVHEPTRLLIEQGGSA
jgi:NAD(P) transhydrogenase subunit alpha